MGLLGAICGRARCANRTAPEGPSLRDDIVWIASTDVAWRDLHEHSGKWPSVYRQFRRWTLSGLHAASMTGQPQFCRKLSRPNFPGFMAKQPPVVVVMEACGSAHYWAREMVKLGHEVKLIAPRYVKPFVKREKNDAADAIVIAAQRLEMRFVLPKIVEQQSRRFCSGRGSGSSTSAPNWSTHLGRAFMNTVTWFLSGSARSSGLQRS